jgi:cAMP-dependent protein kinase regulator
MSRWMGGNRDDESPADIGAVQAPGSVGMDDDATRQASHCFAFLRSVPILFELDDTALWDLARIAEPVEFALGERILGQGQQPTGSGSRFYVIRNGTADVLRRDRSGIERVVARLSVGSYFGELGLLTNQARNATVRVHGTLPLQVYAFDALTFHRSIAEQVLVFRVLRERERRRRGGSPGGRARLRIKELELLRRLPGPDLEFVLEQAEHRWFPERAAIIQQGDPGDRFYILLEGLVDVLRDEEVVAQLHPGDFFGETALLLDMPRNATVRVREHALTWSITRSAFQRLVGGYLLSHPQTQREVLRRMRSALPGS